MATAAHPYTITAEGHRRLQDELKRLCTVERDRLADQLRDLRQDGDLHDNPALLEALEQQSSLERRITYLQEQLAMAAIASAGANGSAGVGTFVVVRDVDAGTTEQYELVAGIESDATIGRLSIDAPIGKALLGLRAGAHTTADTPRGPRLLQLLSVGSAPAPDGRPGLTQEFRPVTASR